MAINNLHSLINGKWFIHEPYGYALLPSLFTVLKGNSLKIKAADHKPEAFVLLQDTAPVAASSFNSKDTAKDFVLRIDLKNPIYKYSQECGPQGTKSKMNIMEQFKNDPNCKGVVLDIDSGGGQVSGTPEFYDYIKNFGKPVVAYTDGLMCSAAYYIGSAANHIIANKRADHIGSIGTMIHFIDLTGYYEKEGAKVITEYATKSTEKNRAFEELIAGKPEKYIKQELDPITEDFINDIKAVRADVNEAVFTGATYSPKQAIKMGLVDELGTLQTAIAKVLELAGTTTNINQKSKSNMSKQRANLQAVLGLDAPLYSTEELGSYLNEEQLDSIETRLEEAVQNAATLQTQLDDQTAAAALETQRTGEALNQVTAFETEIDAMLTAAGETVTGTLAEKMTALSAKVTVMGKADGSQHTIVRTTTAPAGKDVQFQIDAEASHNKIADELLN